MPIPSFAFPTIYFLYPDLVESRSELESCLDRCHDMGFSHVMTHSPESWQGGTAQGPAQLASPTSPGMKADARPESTRPVSLDDIVRSCTERSLQLVLVVDAVDIPAESVPAHLVHSTGGGDEPPDPRKPIGSRQAQGLNLASPQAIEALLEYWAGRISHWMEMGIAGFCCQNLGEVPASFWRDLIQRGRSASASVGWMAWTPGCPAEKVLALADAGFDVTFSSAAWWNYRSEWLTEEHARLRQVGAPVAFPESPFVPAVHCFDEAVDQATRRRAFQRALWLSATVGSGLLIPMGFESGMPEACRRSQASSKSGLRSGFHPDEAAFDLSEEITSACRFIKRLSAASADPNESVLEFLGMGEGGAIALLRRPEATNSSHPAAFVIAANQNLHAEAELDLNRFGERAHGFLPVTPAGASPMDLPSMNGRVEEGRVYLPPGALAIVEARRPSPVLLANLRGKRAIDAAIRVPRVVIENPGPAVDGGRFPVKRIVGELVDVEADVFMDGHDKLGVALLWRPADEADWKEIRMQPLGNDRWHALLPLARLGRHLFVVEAWRDAFATYRDELEKKAKAGLDVRLELEEGRLLVAASAAHAEETGLVDAAQTLADLARLLAGVLDKRGRKADIDPTERIAALLSERTLQAMRQADPRSFAVRSETVLAVDAERPAARFSSWYELFPRSQSGDPQRHGTFADVEKRLPAIRDMGFDTLYFPPIHPIGKRNRKGRNNSLTATKDDPGSPYAIGSEEGGHDAIHPELGTLEDFRHLRDAAARHGLELALDFAIQCSPDHPWLKEHPDWFAWRPDGSLRYAENPPKKYEDIVNVDFYAQGAMPSLWLALRDAVLFWVKEGVRVFRVDNPHTKPLPFWQWMIADIRSRYPDTIFLSEAFTRPKVMYRLAKVGFSQSYTYFTWRNTKAEFIDYMTELTTTPVREFFRPHFFVNTPDINPVFLQHSGRPGFLIRAALATTLSGLWGMYSGFELCEATPVPGKEEYLDSEKYEIRAWDWERPGNIIQEITVLNRIRRTNPALQTHLGVRFCPASDDHILFFVKATAHPSRSERFGDNVIVVAINLDPFSAHEAQLEIPLWRFGMPDDGVLDVEDLVNGNRFSLRGKMQQIRLDPFSQPYAIWRIQPEGGAS